MRTWVRSETGFPSSASRRVNRSTISALAQAGSSSFPSTLMRSLVWSAWIWGTSAWLMTWVESAGCARTGAAANRDRSERRITRIVTSHGHDFGFAGTLEARPKALYVIEGGSGFGSTRVRWADVRLMMASPGIWLEAECLTRGPTPRAPGR